MAPPARAPTRSSSSATAWSATASSRRPSSGACTRRHRIVVVGEERRRAYDRVHLSSLFDGDDADELDARRARPATTTHGVELVLGDPVVALDTAAGTATTASGRAIAYDACVLATGSCPFVPPIPGTDAAGVVRLPHDRRPRRDPGVGRRLRAPASSSAAACSAWRRPTPCACSASTRPSSSSPPGSWPCSSTTAAGARCAATSRRSASHVRTGAAAAAVRTDARRPGRRAVVRRGRRPRRRPGRVRRRHPAPRPARPRAPAWRSASAAASSSTTRCAHVGARRATPSARSPATAAASTASSRPGYAMAEVVADRLAGGDATFTGADLSTTLKLLGVDVASVGDPHADGDEVVRRRPADGHVAAGRRSTPTAGCSAPSLVGDAAPFADARPGRARHGHARPTCSACCARPAGGGRRPGRPARRRPASARATTSSCGDGPRRGRRGLRGRRRRSRRARRPAPAAARACPMLQELDRRRSWPAPGRSVVKRLCAALRDDPARAVRGRAGHRHPHASPSSSTATATGRGCEICKPAVASMFASLVVGLHPRRRAGQPAGHQRPLPRQPPARRHLLGRAPGAGRRDHARPAHRHRRGRPRLRPLHEDHRRPAHRPARRPRRAAARHLGPAASTPASSRATPTARRCAR